MPRTPHRLGLGLGRFHAAACRCFREGQSRDQGQVQQHRTAEKTSTALTNAIAAGNGAPDAVMLEDPTVTQFAVTGDVIDLSAYGADDLSDDFTAGPWNKL